MLVLDQRDPIYNTVSSFKCKETKVQVCASKQEETQKGFRRKGKYKKLVQFSSRSITLRAEYHQEDRTFGVGTLSREKRGYHVVRYFSFFFMEIFYYFTEMKLLDVQDDVLYIYIYLQSILTFDRLCNYFLHLPTSQSINFEYHEYLAAPFFLVAKGTQRAPALLWRCEAEKCPSLVGNTSITLFTLYKTA